MLDIKLEYRKGILFVRLFGVLDISTSEKIRNDVISFIERNGLKFVVYNIDGLEYIDIEGIEVLMENYNVVSNIEGKILLCGLSNKLVKEKVINSSLLNYMHEINNEIGAISVINL